MLAKSLTNTFFIHSCLDSLHQKGYTPKINSTPKATSANQPKQKRCHWKSRQRVPGAKMLTQQTTIPLAPFITAPRKALKLNRGPGSTCRWRRRRQHRRLGLPQKASYKSYLDQCIAVQKIIFSDQPRIDELSKQHRQNDLQEERRLSKTVHENEESESDSRRS